MMMKPRDVCISASLASVKVNNAAVCHVCILWVVGPVGDGEPDHPEHGDEHGGDGGEEEAAHHCHPGREELGLEQVVHSLHLVHPAVREELGQAASPHHLSAGVQGHLQEWNCHCKQHPDVNHLGIGSYRQALRYSKVPGYKDIFRYDCWLVKPTGLKVPEGW